jgi:hypothetical protein
MVSCLLTGLRLRSPQTGHRGAPGKSIRSAIAFLGCSLALAIMGTAGCSKPPPSAAASPSTNATGEASVAPPTHGPGAAAVPALADAVADSGDVNATLASLSQELRKYVVRTRSVPKDFDEFAAKSHLQAPPPPAGKKYAIQNQAVVLVKQ